jgi:hypothetical protein
MKTVEGWIECLKEEFKVNTAVTRAKASRRKYTTDDDDVMKYFYAKLELLRTANEKTDQVEEGGTGNQEEKDVGNLGNHAAVNPRIRGSETDQVEKGGTGNQEEKDVGNLGNHAASSGMRSGETDPVEKDGTGNQEEKDGKDKQSDKDGKIGNHAASSEMSGETEDGKENRAESDGRMENRVEKGKIGNLAAVNPRIRGSETDGVDAGTKAGMAGMAGMAGTAGAAGGDDGMAERLEDWEKLVERAKSGKPTTTDGTFTLIGKTLFFSEKRNMKFMTLHT